MEQKKAPPIRVLLLDDDSTTLLILSHHLQAMGVDVIVCREIEAAEAILDVTRMDAVLTDLCISPHGGLDGTRLVRHVATHFPETELMVMSSHTSEDVCRDVKASGATSFFEKPVDPNALALKLLRRHPGIPPGAPGVVQDVEMLEEFLGGGCIHSVVQPIVSLEGSGAPWTVHAVETLARGPKGSVLRNPEILFGYASRKERLFQTDMLCVQAGLEEAVALGRNPLVFLNIQPRSMTNPDFRRQVVDSVERSGIAPEQIVFEITEQETILNPGAFASTLAQLRSLGFRVALDDFGVGFCNLHLLIDLKPDYVKLPTFFTRGIATDRDRQDTVKALRSLLERRRVPVIMEGVETAEELEAVRALGVEYAQGYHFARPSRAPELRDDPAFRWPAAAPLPV